MKVLWIVLGVLLCFCLMCGGVGYWIFARTKTNFDEGGKFGDDAFRTIASHWSVQDFDRYAAPEIAEQNDKDTIPRLMARLASALGPLKGGFTSHLTGVNATNGATYAD